MLTNLDASKFPLRLEGDCAGRNFLPIAAHVNERVSEIPKIEVHFFCVNEALDLQTIVGNTMHLLAESEDRASKRWFRGTCVSAEFISKLDVGGQFKAIVRPWLWFLSRRTNLRIFQEMSVIDIIQAILGEYGFSGNLELRLTESYVARDYCVQYRETDLDFLHRLMEQEGIYYFFDHSADTEKLVLIDNCGMHEAVAEPSMLDYRDNATKSVREKDKPHVSEWSAAEAVRSAKIVLDDYNFERSTAVLSTESEFSQPTYLLNDYERYDYPGRYRDTSLGEHYAKVRMEAETVVHHLVSGVSDAVNLAVGFTFTVANLPRADDPTSVMILECQRSIIQMEAFAGGFFEDERNVADSIDFALPRDEAHMVKFRVVDSLKQYRAPHRTPWPKVGGIHTAMVTGPGGEEIYTDQYGRIKVQFHWDREGANDENTSCWVRTMTPWTGKNWGAIAIPRIGQEVVIDFEEGDPDRPIVIGMLWNDKTMPPYTLPENKTQSGLKTNSSLGGGGFNELMFEDKQDNELVRFQSEKDYEQIVKNNATITVGLEKADNGDLTQTIKNDFTETVKDGNHSTTLEQGNHNTTLDAGDMDVTVSQGKITVSAAQSIEFVCGNSKFKMDPRSITMETGMFSMSAQMKADLSSPKTTVSGNINLTLFGGMVNIN